MAPIVRPDSRQMGIKQRYQVTNWSAYDQALVNRGNLTIWFDDASLLDRWRHPSPAAASRGCTRKPPFNLA